MASETQGITVEYSEMAGSPLEVFTQEGVTISRKFKCEWADRFEFKSNLLGGLQANGTTTLAMQYEDLITATVNSVKITGFGKVDAKDGDTRISSYADAMVEVEYKTPTPADGSGTEPDADENGGLPYTEEYKPGMEFITISSEKLYFDAGAAQTQPLPEDAAPGIQVPKAEWIYTRHNLTSISSIILDLPGGANSASMHSPTFNLNFPVETLMLDNPVIEVKYDSNGVRTFDITYTFKYDPQTWNKYYTGESATKQFIYGEGETEPRRYYPIKDFTPLFD